MDNRNTKTLLALAAGAGAWLAVRAAIAKRRAYDLRGKVVLITGGSRGLGLLLAREFAREGAILALCARDTAELERAREDLEGRGAEVFTTRCDITDRENVARMVSAIEERFGRVDVLVNNAGVIQVGPMEEMTIADYEEAMQTHFWGSLYATLAVLRGMRQRHQGRIINISSFGGKVSVPHLLPYSASKFALTGLSQGLRSELTEDGIFVTTVCPGLMRTGSHTNAYFKGQHRAEYTLFSITGALPVTSMDAEKAARRIVEACKRGEAELILTFPASIAVIFHSLFPGLTADILSLINRMLPAPGGIGRHRARGQESETALAPSLLTSLSDRAAERNNEAT